MAKQNLNQFQFNSELNKALKEQFSAKFDPATKTWTVGNKAKAEKANALIAKVTGFERDKMIQAGSVEFHNKFNDSHPGYIEFHPLTGASWHFVRADLWARAYGKDRESARSDFKKLMEEMGIQ